MPAGAQGLEKIALCTAGDIITFIGCGTADLFPVHLTAMQKERTIAPHTHLLCTSGGGWFRDIRFFFLLLITAFSRAETGDTEC